MAEHPPRNDRKDKREAKRNGVPETSLEGSLQAALQAVVTEAKARIVPESTPEEMPPAGEEGFDPHSVQSSVDLQSQKGVQRVLKSGKSSPKRMLEKKGILVDKDVHVLNAQSPFEVNEAAQRELDNLSIPSELTEIYGDNIPPAEVLETFTKLKSKQKKDGYLAKVRADVEKEREREEKKAKRPAGGKKSAGTKAGDEGSDSPVAIELGSERQAREEKEAAREVAEAAFSGGLDIDLTEPSEPAVLAEEIVTPVEAAALITPNPEEAIDLGHAREMAETKQEGTPKEWRDKLRGLIEGAKGRFGRSERGDSLEAALEARSKALDAEAKGLGPKVEGFIRSIGEDYNKLSFKKKVALGALLGVGAAVSSGVSAPLAAAFAVNLGLQRAAGMASMFMKFEKHLQDTVEGVSKGLLGRQEWYQNIFRGSSEKQRKVTAAVMALGYSAGMSVAIGEAVKLGSESAAGEAVHEWLKSHYPFGTTGAAVTGTAAVDAAPSPDEIGTTHTPEVSPVAEASVAPEHAVAASASVTPPVEMPTVSAPTAHMTIGASGQISPDGATPITDEAFGLYHDASQEINPLTGLVNEQTPAPVETHVPTPVVHDTAESVTTADGTAVQAESVPMPDEAPPPPTEVPLPEKIPLVDITSNPELISQAPTAVVNEVVNQAGLRVSIDVPHVYSGLGGVDTFVYGGSSSERAKVILEYLTQNPDKVIFSADDSGTYRIPWHLVEGEVAPEMPMRTGGFLGFSSSWMEAPKPDEFAQRLDVVPQPVAPVPLATPADTIPVSPSVPEVVIETAKTVNVEVPPPPVAEAPVTVQPVGEIEKIDLTAEQDIQQEALDAAALTQPVAPVPPAPEVIQTPIPSSLEIEHPVQTANQAIESSAEVTQEVAKMIDARKSEMLALFRDQGFFGGKGVDSSVWKAVSDKPAEFLLAPNNGAVMKGLIDSGQVDAKYLNNPTAFLRDVLGIERDASQVGISSRFNALQSYFRDLATGRGKIPFLPKETVAQYVERASKIIALKR